MTVARTMMRYHGGKWRLAPWLIQQFPEHRVYVEPFGGAASVLLRKPRSYAEVYNDLDEQIVNVFRVARDRGDELKRLLHLTPFSRADFETSYTPHPDPLEQARRTIARSFMGFGSAAATQGANKRAKATTGFRANSNRSGTTPARDWKNYAEVFDTLIDRLRGVVIENRDALEVMSQHDSRDTLHYVDPPYVPSTRDKGSDYRFEMTIEQHESLLQFLADLKGHVVLSGYANELYDEMLIDWHRIDRAAYADGAQPRTETIWMTPHSNPQGVLL